MQWDWCNKCNGSKWYKRPRWVMLARFRFGRFVFHKPTDTLYTDPFPKGNAPHGIRRIEGYIEHSSTRWGGHAYALLILLYKPKAIPGLLRRVGSSWREQWWRPYNWAHNTCHLITRGTRSIPARNLHYRATRAWERIFGWARRRRMVPAMDEDDGLPF
jgi:hypothetical protein